jgi:hypothetical protein
VRATAVQPECEERQGCPAESVRGIAFVQTGEGVNRKDINESNVRLTVGVKYSVLGFKPSPKLDLGLFSQ